MFARREIFRMEGNQDTDQNYITYLERKLSYYIDAYSTVLIHLQNQGREVHCWRDRNGELLPNHSAEYREAEAKRVTIYIAGPAVDHPGEVYIFGHKITAGEKVMRILYLICNNLADLFGIPLKERFFAEYISMNPDKKPPELREVLNIIEAWEKHRGEAMVDLELRGDADLIPKVMLGSLDESIKQIESKIEKMD